MFVTKSRNYFFSFFEDSTYFCEEAVQYMKDQDQSTLIHMYSITTQLCSYINSVFADDVFEIKKEFLAEI